MNKNKKIIMSLIAAIIFYISFDINQTFENQMSYFKANTALGDVKAEKKDELFVAKQASIKTMQQSAQH